MMYNIIYFHVNYSTIPFVISGTYVRKIVMETTKVVKVDLEKGEVVKEEKKKELEPGQFVCYQVSREQ